MMKLSKPPVKPTTAGAAKRGTAKTKLKVSRSKENGRAGTYSTGPLGRTQGPRQSSANGVQRPDVRLIPDSSTVKMANLKRVKFLDPEFEAPSKGPGAMSAEYLKRKQTLDKSLQKVIDTTRVAHMQVLKKSRIDIADEKKAHEEELAVNPLAKLMETAKPKDSGEIQEEDKFADGFIRSKRNTHLRVKQELLSQMRTVEEAKTALIQKLNKALIKLDKQNQAKRDLGEKLLEQVKFVRDLQRAASSGDDIEGVVSTQMKTDFQREKELNLRLREELQRCEKERLRLLERIKLLSGEKEIEVESGDGIKRTFKVTQINIQRILDDLRAHKDTAQANEQLVIQTGEMCRVAEDEIISREREIDALVREKTDVEQRYHALESRYRDTVYLNEGARNHMGGLHRMHVKLLATRQLEESLQKAFDRTKKSAVEQMLWVTRGYVNQFGAIYRLRNLIKQRDALQAKNAIARWFKLACDPMMLIEQNKKIPEFFAKHHTERLVFNREFEQWMLNQGLRSQQSSQLRTMKGRLGNFWNRELKLRFNMWKDNVRARTSGLKVIDRALSKTRYYETARAFGKWVHYIKNQDFNARLHGMAVMTAQTQTETRIFYEWKMWAYANKRNRQALQRRTIRSLRNAVGNRKHLQKMALSALGFQLSSDKSILKQCFDQLRQNKEQEKLIFMTDKLTVETEPALMSLNSQMQQLQSKSKLNDSKRATNTFVTVFGRLLSQYFQKWKESAKFKGTELNGKFKIRLIKLYRSKLEKCFNLWRVNRNAMIIDMQTMEFEDFQNSNQEIEAVCRQREIKIKAVDMSSRNMGAKHIKKLVTAAFLRNVKSYFDKWRKKNTQSNTQTNTADRILQKIRRRYLRMAWNKYRWSVGRIEQEDKNEGRLCDVKVRLDFKQKKRCYQAIKLFNRRQKTARRFMKTLINGIDKANKDSAFRIWKKFNEGETIMKFEQEQGELMVQMNEMQQLDGTVANKLQKTKDKCARVESTLKRQCQNTLKKWVARCHGQGMNWAFATWKSNQGNLKHRESLITRIKKQMLRHTMRNAWDKWNRGGQAQQISMSEMEIQHESVAMEVATNQVHKINDQRKAQADRSSRQIAVVNAEAAKVLQQQEKTVGNLIEQNQGKFFTSKLNYVFHGWKEYMDRRKRCCAILSTALKKTALQKAFIRINLYQRADHKEFRKEKKSGRLFNLYAKYRCKAALSMWREQEFKNVQMMQMETMQEMSSMQEDFSIKKENIKKHHVAVRSGRVAKSSAKEWFVRWQVYASEERDCRKRTENLQMALKCRKGARALNLWKMRMEKTKQMRAFLKRGKFVKKQINLKSCFLAMKNENRNERRFTNRIYAIMENMRNLNCQSAFDLIKRYAAEKASRNGQNKLKAKDIMIRACENYNECKLRVSFNKMRQNVTRCNTREMKIKTALNHMATSQIRSLFYNWKDKAHQIQVYAQNEEEDGPTNLEAWQLRQDNFNLIRLCKEDGLTNKEIAKVHQLKEEQYRAGVEKSLCRMLCKQNDQLSALPAALEQWKKFTKLRKIWRRVLKDVEIRTTQPDEVSAKLWAFRRMQYSHEDRQAALWGKPIAELRRKCVDNVEKLDKLADKVETGDSEVNELTGQRNLLIKGQVQGQKLALSLGVQNQHRTKMVAMSKFHDYGTKKLQAKIEEAIKANLDRIGGMKDTISQFENDNVDLAKQNDEFRKGAMDGITMVRHVEGLTEDRDKLSCDLADKALTIRKLLEDNQYLQNKLSNAKNQTNQIIDATKKRMGTLDSDQHIPNRETSPTIQVKSRENYQHDINGGMVGR